LDDNKLRGDVPTIEQEISSIIVQEQGGHAKYAMNNDINILQQTDNMGKIEFNTVKVMADPQFQEAYEASLHEPLRQMKIYQENNKSFFRLDGVFKTPLYDNEWSIIKDSYNYDKDITKPFVFDSKEKGGQTIKAEYKKEFVNEYEYYFELANNNPEFFKWLDARNKRTESRSFISYVINSKIKASNIDINNYLKSNKIINLFHSVESKPHTRNYRANEQQKAILDTHEIGINNIEAFVLSSAMSSMFATLITQNIKKIGDNPIINKFEVGQNKQDFKDLDDSIIAGMFSKGSQIRNAIETGGSELNQYQRTVLDAIFQQKSFKSMAEYEISNRYGEIVINFFGNQETRTHQLENNTGIVLFNIGLVCLSYYASYIDSNTTMGIDTNQKSNLIKIISNFLATLYPKDKYPSELIRQIDGFISLLTSEVKAVHRGQNTNSNLNDIMEDVILQLLHRSFSETPTSFQIQDFFVQETLDHLISNFGLEIFYEVNDIPSLAKFLAKGFVDSAEFNKIVFKTMETTLGKNFGFNGNDLYDVLFMTTTQANVFLTNPKYNILIPCMHPEVIDIIPEEKVSVYMIGFNARIIGLVEYNKKQGIYRAQIEEDINKVSISVDEEPVFLEKEEAQERVEFLQNNTVVNEKVENVVKEFIKENPDAEKMPPDVVEDIKKMVEDQDSDGIIQDTHEHDGTFMAGVNHMDLMDFYEAMESPLYNPAMCMPEYTELFDNDKIPEDKMEYNEELRVIVDDDEEDDVEDIIQLGDYEDIDDYKLISIIDVFNNKYDDDIEKELKETVKEWKENEIKMDIDEDGKAWAIVKDEKTNNLFIIFRGTQTGAEWWNNLMGGSINLGLTIADLSLFGYSVAGKLDYLTGLISSFIKKPLNDILLKDHAGFTDTFDLYRKKLMEIVKNRTNKQTKITVMGHSRGDAFANLMTEELVDNNFQNIKYRGFAGINFRSRKSASNFDSKTIDIDIKRYYTEADPLRALNNFYKFYPTGNNILIKTKDAINLGGLAKEEPVKFNGNWAVIKDYIIDTTFGGLTKFHFSDSYKKLLKQRTNSFEYKSSKDIYSEQNENVGAWKYATSGLLGIAYIGNKYYKHWKGKKQQELNMQQIEDLTQTLTSRNYDVGQLTQLFSGSRQAWTYGDMIRLAKKLDDAGQRLDIQMKYKRSGRPTLEQRQKVSELREDMGLQPETEPVESQEVETVENQEVEPVENQEVEPVENQEVEPVENQEELEPVENQEVEPVENQELEPVESKEDVEPVENKEDVEPVENKEDVEPVENQEDVDSSEETQAPSRGRPKGKKDSVKRQRLTKEQAKRYKELRAEGKNDLQAREILFEENI
jgi:predicted transcriptional regulator with HTH domain